MSNTKAVFKQVDIKRAAKGVADAGLSVGRVEVCSDGKIIVIVQNGLEPTKNDWD